MRKNNNISPTGIFLVVLVRTKEQLYGYRAVPLGMAHYSENYKKKVIV